MRLFPSRRVSGRAWWGLFALLIAAPALALSWLGLRAVRADRLEAEQQMRAQQRQVAQLADAAIQNALAQLQTELTRRHAGRPDPGAVAIPADAPLILFHRSGLVTFPGDRLYFGPFGRTPPERSALTEWPASIARMVDEAQALEIQRRARDAIALFERIGRAEPRLQTWAAIAAARARLHDDPSALSQLSADSWARSTGVTPSGLPAAFVAAAAGEGRDARAGFVPLIRATLDGLHAGRWWLSADERRFYDGHLRTLLAHAGAPAPPADARLARLAEIDQLVRQFPPSRRSGPTHVLERGGSSTYLVAWSPADDDPDAWHGAAVDQARLASWLASRLDTLFAGQPFGGAIRDSRGDVLWLQGERGASAWHAEPLRTLAGWEMTFSGPAAHPTFARRQWLWYASVSLLLVLLLAGVGMTAQVVRREMELTRMQAEFVAAVTHEFKSPITSIRLLLERVTSGRFSTPQAAEHYYAAIGQETDRLERLVNRLLEAQRIESGERRYAFHPESLEELTSDAVRHLQPIAEARNIRIDVHSDRGLPPVAVDRAVIADAIENLIDNAIKYSRGGTRVLVRLQAAGDRVSVDVADQGIGIERDELSRVFDKFYRAHRGDLQSVRGTGLGLALVKAAAEAHGGSVEVESEPGVGSRFSLTLPAAGDGWQVAGGR